MGGGLQVSPPQLNNHNHSGTADCEMDGTPCRYGTRRVFSFRGATKNPEPSPGPASDVTEREMRDQAGRDRQGRRKAHDAGKPAPWWACTEEPWASVSKTSACVSVRRGWVLGAMAWFSAGAVSPAERLKQETFWSSQCCNKESSRKKQKQKAGLPSLPPTPNEISLASSRGGTPPPVTVDRIRWNEIRGRRSMSWPQLLQRRPLGNRLPLKKHYCVYSHVRLPPCGQVHWQRRGGVLPRGENKRHHSLRICFIPNTFFSFIANNIIQKISFFKRQ